MVNLASVIYRYNIELRLIFYAVRAHLTSPHTFQQSTHYSSASQTVGWGLLGGRDYVYDWWAMKYLFYLKYVRLFSY